MRTGLVAAAFALSFLARPAPACDPPRVVSLETTLALGEAEAAVSVTAYFLRPRATFSVTGSSLPAPESGLYRLVLASPGETDEVGTFGVDASGAAGEAWEYPFDLRGFALEADALEIWDGETLVAATPIATRGQLSLTASASRGNLPTSPRLTFTGFIERRSLDYRLYDFRITAQNVPRGEYVLELAGLTDDYQIPFTVDATRRVDERVRGSDQDLIARTLLWDVVRVYRYGVLVGTIALECR